MDDRFDLGYRVEAFVLSNRQVNAESVLTKGNVFVGNFGAGPIKAPQLRKHRQK